jgi:hypothetical protein
MWKKCGYLLHITVWRPQSVYVVMVKWFIFSRRLTGKKLQRKVGWGNHLGLVGLN